METKKIVQALKCCHNLDECEDCEYNELGEFCGELLKRDAAKRLEELEAELEKRTINDRPYEWISVEDRLPEKNKLVLGINKVNGAFGLWDFGSSDDAIGFISHWMPLPEPPKPKEPTFKDVFLEKFPKAVVLPKSGSPVVCAKQVFPQLGDDESPCDMCCAVCWNQPYFEAKAGEADA